MMNEIENIFNLLSSLEDIFPEGTSKELEIVGHKISISNNDGNLSIHIESKEDFDDNTIKTIIATYKENIKDLDNDIFIEAIKDMREEIDLKEMDRLLSLDKFTEEEANDVEDMINCASEIIADKLQDKINELVDLYQRF